VSGQTKFADDLALPRMLFGRILRSPLPHARILSVDTTRAKALPGVLAVLTGDDLPIKFGILPVSQDEEALAGEKVRYVGDPIAAVAATDEWIADEALVLIDVQRAGPSTGMPTKTEQGDLLQILFGRNSDSPIPVVAPATPGECFELAIEVAQLIRELLEQLVRVVLHAGLVELHAMLFDDPVVPEIR